MKFRIFQCLLFWGLILSFFFRADSVHSQQIGLSISPPILEVAIEPGKQITKAYELTNKSDRPLYLVPKIITFEPADDQGNIKLLTTSHKNPAPHIFSLANSNLDLGKGFKLDADASQQLVLKIDIPKNNRQKDYYQTLIIEQSDEGGYVNQTGGKSLIKIGSNILLSVAEGAAPEKKAQIEQFSAQPKFADLFDGVKFKIIAYNNGRHFFKTYGKIKINHLWFKHQKELTLLPENVLAQSSRQVNCAKINPHKQNNETQTAQVTDCKFSSWLPGPYQAKLNISPDSGEKVSAKIIFWLIPIKGLLAVLIIFILIFEIRRRIALDKDKSII